MAQGSVSYDFTGAVALVTGAASGMGLATARAFAQAGACVTLADVDGDTARKAAAQLKEEGHQALAIACDVADELAVRDMVTETVAAFGRLDVAFNNAGVQSPATDTADSQSSEYDRVTSINLRGVWACMKHELAQMRAQDRGAIVNCSSLGGLVGVPGRGVYHAAKHGVLGFTKSAALEYAATGVRINAVCPGIIDTPMAAGMKATETEAMDTLMQEVPARRLGSSAEIANAVLWLCSSGSSYVIGHALAVDGGYTVR
nr:glucose 1-dehydrogenase [Rhodovibrio salinarum]